MFAASILFGMLFAVLVPFVHQFFIREIPVSYSHFHVTYREHRSGAVYRTEPLPLWKVWEQYAGQPAWRFADRRFAQILAIEAESFAW